jgi:hypothetical protein
MQEMQEHDQLKENSSAVEEDGNIPPGGVHDKIGGWSWVCDQEGIYTFCSPQVFGHLRVPEDKFLGQSLLTFNLHPESSRMLTDELTNDVYPLELETRFQSSGGGWIDVRMHVFCRRADDNTIQEWFGFNLLLPHDSDALAEDSLKASCRSTLALAVEMIRRGLKLEARRLLQMVLQVNPHDVKAWIWLAETFSSDMDRLRIMSLFLENHPENRFAEKAVAALQKKSYKQELEKLLVLHEERATGEEIPVQPARAESSADLAASRSVSIIEDEFAGAGIPVGESISQVDRQETVKQKRGRRRASDYMPVILAMLTILITILLAITWAIVR